MVAKPNLPPPSDKEPKVEGSTTPTPTPGLTALDREREASMADEGSASGAAVEAEARPPGEAGRAGGSSAPEDADPGEGEPGASKSRC